MALGDEDVAVRRDEHVVRLEEELRVASAAGLAERQQQLAVRAELEDLVALRRVGQRAAAALRPRRDRGRRGWCTRSPRPRCRRPCPRMIPCGERIIPAPNDFTSVAVRVELSTGSSVEPTQLFAPQRSATQTLRPSRSIATALVEPQVRPSGHLGPAFDRPVRIRQVVRGLHVRLGTQRRRCRPGPQDSSVDERTMNASKGCTVTRTEPPPEPATLPVGGAR